VLTALIPLLSCRFLSYLLATSATVKRKGRSALQTARHSQRSLTTAVSLRRARSRASTSTKSLKNSFTSSGSGMAGRTRLRKRPVVVSSCSVCSGAAYCVLYTIRARSIALFLLLALHSQVDVHLATKDGAEVLTGGHAHKFERFAACANQHRLWKVSS
jgi:hypothetical protein